MFEMPKNAVEVIKASLQACLNNTATFPEHVKTIVNVGVARYEVDLLNNKIMYYLVDGTIHTENLLINKNYSKISFFSKSDVKTAISEIQRKAIDYPTFLNRIVSAGTTGYEVNIDEGKVIYRGENDNYTENFPKFSK